MVVDAVRNASDGKQVRDAGKKERRIRERDLKDVSWILSTEAGRRFVWKYLGFCNVFASSFDGERPYQMSCNEGKRMVGLALLNDVADAVPEAFDLMRREAKDREVKGDD